MIAGAVGLQEKILRQISGHRENRLFLRDAIEGVFKSTFQHQAIGEDQIGGHDLLHVISSGFVEVWINPRTHELSQLDPFATNLSNDVSHHADGGHDLESTAVARRTVFARSC